MPAWHANVAGVEKHTLAIAGESIDVRFATTRAAASDATGLVNVRLDAAMSDPSTLPSAVEAGATTFTTINGLEYLLRLLGSVDTRHEAAINATGERIRFLALQVEEWTRTREAEVGTNSATGSPVYSESTATVKAHIAWRGQGGGNLAYLDEMDALLTCLPGYLQAGDTVENATYGTLEVLGGGVRPLGPVDTVQARRAP